MNYSQAFMIRNAVLARLEKELDLRIADIQMRRNATQEDFERLVVGAMHQVAGEVLRRNMRPAEETDD